MKKFVSRSTYVATTTSLFRVSLATCTHNLQVSPQLAQQFRFARSHSASTDKQFGGEFNPYKILGVTPQTPPKDVKKAYQRLALKYHPDNSETGDNKKFQAVHEAYTEVKDGKVWNGMNNSNSDSAGGGAGRNTSGGEGNSKYRRSGGFYAYEEPGSTTENYFQDNRRMGTFVKLVLLYSFGFILIRLILFGIFPLKGQGIPRKEGQASQVQSHPPTEQQPTAEGIDPRQPLVTNFARQAEQEKQQLQKSGLGVIGGHMGDGNDSQPSGSAKIWKF